jgi:hypothetical protein
VFIKHPLCAEPPGQPMKDEGNRDRWGLTAAGIQSTLGELHSNDRRAAGPIVYMRPLIVTGATWPRTTKPEKLGLVNCTAASRKECVNAKGSHWGRSLVSCVAEQLQENLCGSLRAEG